MRCLVRSLGWVVCWTTLTLQAYSVEATRPGLKARVLETGQVELFPDLPQGTAFEFEAVDTTHLRLNWVANGRPAHATYTAPLSVQIGVSPTPEPPVPPPVPPVPATGIKRVLVLFETTDNGTPKMPAEQGDIMATKSVLDYLASHTIKDETQRPAYRFFDKDASLDKVAKPWQDMKAVAGTAYPVVVILPVTGDPVVKPLPANAAAFLSLLQTYGGK